METTNIWIDNLKCGGCANTIKKNVKSFKGVEQVMVNPESEMISIAHNNPLDLIAIKLRLKELGYPEKGTTEGFEKLSTGIKSYVSCAIGRLSKDEDAVNHQIDNSQVEK
jgi:copper chaperone